MFKKYHALFRVPPASAGGWQPGLNAALPWIPTPLGDEAQEPAFGRMKMHPAFGFEAELLEAAATPCAGARAGEGAVGKGEGFAFGSSCSGPGSSGDLRATMVPGSAGGLGGTW